ncbi:MAG: hypothetical protein A2V65_12005 [Deltaproteobacteria bacterium RBG_13_49_15]|nr:MAG: hypothetical protein A2V65_12005 [Deltaproteobacteria bacterium RBG_13_49_15]
MNKASSIITVIVVLLMVMPGMVWGADKALRGIKGLLVVVEKINPEIEKDGLTENQIQTDVELKLRMAGLNVLTSEERKKAPGRPFFYLRAHILKLSSKVYIFHINLILFQDAYLERNDEPIVASTWSSSGLGETDDLDIIRSKVKDHVDEFLNIWLSVNPK